MINIIKVSYTRPFAIKNADRTDLDLRDATISKSWIAETLDRKEGKLILILFFICFKFKIKKINLLPLCRYCGPVLAWNPGSEVSLMRGMEESFMKLFSFL